MSLAATRWTHHRCPSKCWVQEECFPHVREQRGFPGALPLLLTSTLS